MIHGQALSVRIIIPANRGDKPRPHIGMIFVQNSGIIARYGAVFGPNLPESIFQTRSKG